MNLSFNHITAAAARTAASPALDTPPNQENTHCLQLGRKTHKPPATTLPALPAEFRPREAKNMPLSEKISVWLANVPWIQLENDTWVSDCYPGHTSSSGTDDMKSTADDQDIFEQQARQITRMIRANYLHDNEPCARPLTSDFRRDDDYYGYAPIDLDGPDFRTPTA